MPEAEDARVEVDVPRRIGRDAGDVMDPFETHVRNLAVCSLLLVKIGIVVPFSWSFWGAVVEHAELQAAALEGLGHDVRLIMGNDPPGQFTRVLHPRVGRHGDPPANVIAVGRSVIVPANGSLPNIVLSPRSYARLHRTLTRERFDVLHLHEPMTPAICTAVLVMARTPLVATFHASGELGWLRFGAPVWGFLMDRIDHRIAVSDRARVSQNRWLPGEYDVLPNGVLVPGLLLPVTASTASSSPVVRKRGRGCRCCFGHGQRSAARSGLRLTIAGADPLAVRLLLTRLGVSDEGIDIVGFLSQDDLTRALLDAKALVAPSLGQESFGMVLTRAFACALPAVASDIPGYREVLDPNAAIAIPPGDTNALANAVCELVGDEPRRQALGEAARELAVERYSWPVLARRLEEIYGRVTGIGQSRARAA